MLSRRESGGRLLPAGVLGVLGAFASGQAVRIVIYRQGNKTSPETVKKSYPSSLADSSSSSPAEMSIALPVSSNSSTAETGNAIQISQPLKGPDLGSREQDLHDVVEVGRGLANYNSAQIAMVQGLNRYDYISNFYM